MAEELDSTFNHEQPQTPEQAPEFGNVKIERSETPTPAPIAAPPIAIPAAPAPRTRIVKDPTLSEIENVLSENIADLYKKLPAEKKQLFKIEGEKIATQINAMMKSGVLRLKKILELILGWLKIIPGINKFYLEQEAKIKADKILFIYDREHATT